MRGVMASDGHGVGCLYRTVGTIWLMAKCCGVVWERSGDFQFVDYILTVSLKIKFFFLRLRTAFCPSQSRTESFNHGTRSSNGKSEAGLHYEANKGKQLKCLAG